MSRRLTALAAWGLPPAVLLPFALVTASTAAETTTEETVARVVARYSPVVDSSGKTWKPRTGFIGTDRNSRSLVGTDILGTNDDVLYQETTFGTTGYTLPVTSGRYRVRLLMVENYWTKAGQRVFDVSAEGKPALEKVDIAGAVGARTAYDRTFETDVTDGSLDLSFTKVVDNPQFSAIEVTKVSAPTSTPTTTPIPEPTPTPAPETVTPTPVNNPPGRAPIPLASDSPWTSRIENAPLDPKSAEMAANLHKDVIENWGGIAAFNNTHYNASFYPVPADQPRIDVDFWNCQRKTWIDPNLTTGPAYFRQVPVPDYARAAVGTDGEMSIYDPHTDQLWEFWQMRRNATSGRWEACWGGRIDNVSSSQGIFPQWYGATGTGVAMAAGMISLDEVREGRIDHAMYLAAMNIQQYPEISWPALRGDGNLVDPNVVREGQRLRLDPNLDLDRYNLTPVGRMVAEAAKKYGFIVSDRSGSVAVIGEAGLREETLTGTNPWPGLLGGMPSYEVMRNFPWEAIQVVAKDWGAPS
ncbi:malectin domain-containing carbohydrate-binding protein [Austwickia chelonae]|uniref:malectin domain-containing carbohydrate-binding protein n=1 Tax=Austwickia chelonae TaxID=100225 RepID=UPI0013C2F275|nr:malectin domain-containing carbohydrate-binding protein [Austwickia chelonae]